MNAWALLGNAGTVDGTNFLGTTDNIPFNIRVNNIVSGRIDQLIGNTFFGYLSNGTITTGQNNTAFGDRALGNNTTGNQNTAVGSLCISDFIPHTGTNNTAVGHNSLRYNSNNNNTAVGALSLSNNPYTGDLNTAVGYSALLAASSGTKNTAIGGDSLSALTSGNENIGIGYLAQVPSPIGNNQIAIGTANETLYIQGGFNYKVGTPITAAIVLSGVLSQFYTVNATGAGYTITLPTPAAYIGTVVNFRKVGGSSVITFTSAIAIIPYNSPTIPAVGPTLLTATQYSTTIICDGAFWYQMQTV